MIGYAFITRMHVSILVRLVLEMSQQLSSHVFKSGYSLRSIPERFSFLTPVHAIRRDLILSS